MSLWPPKRDLAFHEAKDNLSRQPQKPSEVDEFGLDMLHFRQVPFPCSSELLAPNAADSKEE